MARRLVVAALAGLLVAPAAAQEPEKLEPVVVTATKLEAAPETLGAAVTVIPGEELRAYHYQDLADVLRRVPGLDVQRSGTLGKLTSVRIRGAGPAQIQVLVDGVRVKSPTTGQFDFSDLALENIERIEIVRGPQSTLYGADAIGGVVHVITRRGRGRPSGTLHVEAGTRETFRQRLTVGGAVGPFDFSLGALNQEAGGWLPNDDSEQRAASVRLGLALPREGRLSLAARYSKSAIDLPVDHVIPERPFFVRDPDAQQQSEQSTVSLQWDQKPVPWYEVHVRVGQMWNNLGFQDPLTPGLDDAATVSQINTRRREVELLQSVHVGRWTTATLGLEHRDEWAQNRGTFFEEVVTRALFVQDELRLFDRLFVTGGVRVEDHETFGTETTPRVSLALLVRETGTRLRGGWGEGFRAPTLNDLFFPGFANPTLKPERSESWDVGLDQRLWRDRLRLGLTYFDNRFENLIQIQFDPALCPPGNPFGCPLNVGRARTRGLEATAEADVLDTLLLSLAYTFTDARDLDLDRPLRRVPRHRWALGLSWDPTPRLNLFAQASVVSSQFESEGFPRNEGHHRVDVGGTWRLTERRGAFPALDLTWRVQNLTDQRYFEVLGFRAPGISVLAGLRATY